MHPLFFFDGITGLTGKAIDFGPLVTATVKHPLQLRQRDHFVASLLVMTGVSVSATVKYPVQLHQGDHFVASLLVMTGVSVSATMKYPVQLHQGDHFVASLLVMTGVSVSATVKYPVQLRQRDHFVASLLVMTGVSVTAYPSGSFLSLTATLSDLSGFKNLTGLTPYPFGNDPENVHILLDLDKFRFAGRSSSNLAMC